MSIHVRGNILPAIMIFEKYPLRVCLIITPDDWRRPVKSSLVTCAGDVVDIIVRTVDEYSALFNIATSNNDQFGRHFLHALTGSKRETVRLSVDNLLEECDRLYPGVKCTRCPVWTNTGVTCVECSCGW